MRSHNTYLPCAGRLATATALTLSVIPVSAQTTPAPAAASWFEKPAWLQDLSLTVKESYDNNVFLSDVSTSANRGSWITTVAPKVGVNLAPLLGKQSPISLLSFGYAPDFVIFHDESSESYDAHRTTQAFKGKSGDVSFSAENGFTYVDGNTLGPLYPGGRSGIATGAPRERREQYQDRAKVSVQFDQEKWFFRPTASLLYYDLMTEFHSSVKTPGYENYPDRYDVNGGADFGYKVQPNLAVTLGYRYGHQYQQQLPDSIDPLHLSSPSDYSRVLLGLEGKPWKWFTVSLQGGPDFRHYPDDSDTHTTPVNDHDPIKYYGEASLSAEVTSKDTVAFKYRQWQFVSSTGRIPCFDSSYDLSYRHKFSSAFSADLGGRIQSLDYTQGSATTSQRDDWLFTVSAGLNYAFSRNLSGTLAYSFGLGRNAQDGIPEVVEQGRQFEQHLVSLGIQYKF